jgi:DHA1 family bicyclomycin/chloramphenicol resistance-like MFS transporter
MARVMSFVLAAFITAPLIAPSIGAVILGFGSWRWIFWFLAVYGAVLLVLVLLFVEESLAAPDPRSLAWGRIVGAYRAVLGEPLSRRYGAAAVISIAMLLCYLVSAAPIFMTRYGLSPTAFGLVFALIAVCSAFGSLVNTRLVRHLPLERITFGAFVGAALALVAGLGAGVARPRHALGADRPLRRLLLRLQHHRRQCDDAGDAAARHHHRGRGLGPRRPAEPDPAGVATLVAALDDGTPRPAMLTMLALSLLGLWLIRPGGCEGEVAPHPNDTFAASLVTDTSAK